MRLRLVIAIICTRYGVVVVVWIIRGPFTGGRFFFPTSQCKDYVFVMANLFFRLGQIRTL